MSTGEQQTQATTGQPHLQKQDLSQLVSFSQSSSPPPLALLLTGPGRSESSSASDFLPNEKTANMPQNSGFRKQNFGGKSPNEACGYRFGV